MPLLTLTRSPRPYYTKLNFHIALDLWSIIKGYSGWVCYLQIGAPDGIPHIIPHVTEGTLYCNDWLSTLAEDRVMIRLSWQNRMKLMQDMLEMGLAPNKRRQARDAFKVRMEWETQVRDREGQPPEYFLATRLPVPGYVGSELPTYQAAVDAGGQSPSADTAELRQRLRELEQRASMDPVLQTCLSGMQRFVEQLDSEGQEESQDLGEMLPRA